MNIVERKVTSVDSVQSLAAQYLGDSSRWRDIVDFNNLDYPYITTDPNFQTQAYASGSLAVARPYTGSLLTIPAGTLFSSPDNTASVNRTYKSLQSVTLAAGVATASIPVQCTVAGFWGNVPAGAITTIITSNTLLKAAFSSITNPAALNNGKILNVKLLGDSLLIPVDGTWDGTTAYNDINKYYEAQFGIDVAIGSDGDLIFDGYGAVGTVSGVNNLAQAARDRLTTPRLSLPYHPEYGQIIDQMIPKPGTPYARKMIALGIQETLLMDDRIGRVNVVNLTQAGTALNAVVDIFPVQGGDSIRVPFALPNISI